jgi:hypothetical protein
VETSKEKEEKEETKTQNAHVIAMHIQYIVNYCTRIS